MREKAPGLNSPVPRYKKQPEERGRVGWKGGAPRRNFLKMKNAESEWTGGNSKEREKQLNLSQCHQPHPARKKRKRRLDMKSIRQRGGLLPIMSPYSKIQDEGNRGGEGASIRERE